MTAVLVDDQLPNLELLHSMLNKYCPSVAVIGKAQSVEKALELIMKTHPDVIFLDMEIEQQSAENILLALEMEHVQVIIVTAYEKYALKMHKYSVTDYLLKPLIITDLIAAVHKVQKSMERTRQLEASGYSRYIALPEKEHMNITNIDKIMRLEGLSNYTKIITREEKTLISAKTLKEFEELLPRAQFLRVHHSHIVNIDYVSKYLRTKNGSLVLLDGTEVPISANRRKDVMERIVF